MPRFFFGAETGAGLLLLNIPDRSFPNQFLDQQQILGKQRL